MPFPLGEDPSVGETYAHFNNNGDAVLAYHQGLIDEDGNPTEYAIETTGDDAPDYSNVWFQDQDDDGDDDDDDEDEVEEEEEEEDDDDDDDY